EGVEWGPGVGIVPDPQVGGIPGRLTVIGPESARGLLGRDPSPEAERRSRLAAASVPAIGAFLGTELDPFQDVAPDRLAHVGGRLDPHRLHRALVSRRESRQIERLAPEEVAWLAGLVAGAGPPRRTPRPPPSRGPSH